MKTIAGREIETIILDRDGVLNIDSPDYVKSAKEWQWIEGSIAAIKILSDKKIPCFIATNQAGIGRGLYSHSDLFAIHKKMLSDIHMAGAMLNPSLNGHLAIFYCPHHPEENCVCRKPKPGLLLDIEQQYGVDLSKACFVGDSKRDLQAAMAANVLPIYVYSGKEDPDITSFLLDYKILSFKNLLDFVFFLCKKST